MSGKIFIIILLLQSLSNPIQPNMKKFLKWTGIVFLSLVLMLVLGITLMQFKKYDAPYPDIHASKDASVIARGKYLVTGPAHCGDCHAPRSEYNKILAGQIASMRGGNEFKLPLGTLRTPNLTSDPETGIGNWKDEEIARSLRYGVGRDGRALIPFMPFQNLTDDDLTAVISYLRTLKPEANKVKVRSLNPLGYTLTALVIRPVGPVGTPAKHIAVDTTESYGAYLANYVSNCKGCHTNRDLKTGAFVGPLFAGGFHMESIIDPEHFECVTPNLTPDPSTGRIARWSEEDLKRRFAMGKVIPHSAMPWGPFKRMGDVEMKAIYKYLQTLKPVTNDPGPMLVKKT